MKISDATDATGKSRTTLLRAIKNGKLSAKKDDEGAWEIDAAELARVYEVRIPGEHGGVQNAPVRTPVHGAPSTGQNARVDTLTHTPSDTLAEANMWKGRYEEAKIALDDMRTTTEDLRERLDRSEEKRDEVQTKLTAILTDQRPKIAPEQPVERPRVRTGQLVALAAMVATVVAFAAVWLNANGLLGGAG